MSNSFTNQTLAQMNFGQILKHTKTKCTCYQNIWMKKVAALHLKKLGVELETLSRTN